MRALDDLAEELRAELAALPVPLYADVAEALRHARHARLQEVSLTIHLPYGPRPWDWEIGYAGRGRRRTEGA